MKDKPSEEFNDIVDADKQIWAEIPKAEDDKPEPPIIPTPGIRG